MTGEFDMTPHETHYRDVLVVVLTFGTGALDAVTFLRLGKVFSSVITGNLALLGVTGGQHNGTLALNGGLALAGYALGVMLGSPLARTPERGQPAWPLRVTLTLTAELAILIAFCAEWLASGDQRGTASRLALLVLGAAAMGMQSVAVRRLGQMSSTYMTSTLTGVLGALALRQVPPEWQRSVGALISLVVGAIVGALAAVESPSWVPAAVLVPIATVISCSLARRRWGPGRQRSRVFGVRGLSGRRLAPTATPKTRVPVLGNAEPAVWDVRARVPGSPGRQEFPGPNQYRALPEPEVPPDSRPVSLDRPAVPRVKPQLSRRNIHQPRDVGDGLVPESRRGPPGTGRAPHRTGAAERNRASSRHAARTTAPAHHRPGSNSRSAHLHPAHAPRGVRLSPQVRPRPTTANPANPDQYLPRTISDVPVFAKDPQPARGGHS